jgi:hypothetical protein
MTIEFSVVNGAPLGTATLSGEVVHYSGELIREIMAPTVSRVGPAKAFRRFANYSNGYVIGKAIA